MTLDLEALRRRGARRVRGPRALQGARVPGAGARVRAGGRRRAAADQRLALTRAEIDAVVQEARAAGRLALGVVVTGTQAMRAHPLGLALVVDARPLGLRAARPLEPRPAAGAARLPRRWRRCGRCSRTRRVRKVSAHAKRDRVVLERLGVRVAGLAFDALLAAYLLDPGRRGLRARGRRAWSTWASVARPGPTASPRPTRRRTPASRSRRAPRPSWCCGSSRR